MSKEIEKQKTKPELKRNEDGLALVGEGLSMRGDFTKMIPRIKGGKVGSELIVRAAKIKGLDRMPTVLDATAGMGEDSLLLAAAGFRVSLYEQDEVIAALLQDTLMRAADIPELADIVSRMTFTHGDSITAMRQLTSSPDVVLLDPMFPARQKSGLVKKKFQLLQQLEQPCSDEEELMDAAMAAHPKKIIVKRPAKGPFLAGVKPSYSIKGKGIRYDCILLP